MLHFSIALPCEAQGIIDRYLMKPSGSHGRARFFEGVNARLAITGVGSLPSAIATTALGIRYPNSNAIWLNVGICGHRNAAIGEVFIANRVSTDTSRDNIYPQSPWKSPFKGIELVTLAEPSTDYQANQAFDMEGFGFYKASLAFASTEFIHCIKVVSDNAAQPANRPFDKEAITRMIEERIPTIESFCSTIENDRPQNTGSEWSTTFSLKAKACFSFTETETHQLNKRLVRLDTLLNPIQKAEIDSLTENPKKKDFLAQLQLTIDRLSASAIY